MNRALLSSLILTVIFSLTLVIRTLLFSSPAPDKIEFQSFPINKELVAKHMSEAIGFYTVSASLSSQSTQLEFKNFIKWLKKTYPVVHAKLNPITLGNYSRLFTWTGSQPNLDPILLSAHYDVVPVIPGTTNLWKYPPYSGYIDKTHIWGRGALDDKSAAISIMEAVTLLLTKNFQPKRTIYISLTHDEEVGGHKGTASVVKHLKDSNVKLAWSLDEGSFLLNGFFPEVDTPLASINVAEKGYLTVDIIARSNGGHSSMPPKETAIGILASALLKLQNNPLPGGLDGLSGQVVNTAAQQMPFEKRLLFANQWLFGPIIEYTLSKTPSTNAMLRTTTAPTMLSASIKDNVLAIEATGTVNFRVHPRDKVSDVIDYVKTTIKDQRVDIKVRDSKEASRVSSSTSWGYTSIATATHSTYGPVLTAPGITIATTDSRQYETISKNEYRFNPMVITPEDVTGFHGTNERISIDNMIKAVTFYAALMKNTGTLINTSLE